jgi:sugar-specific transcriptional regulator TrmB
MYQELETFGLTPEETKYYILLINHKTMTLDDIASQSAQAKRKIVRSLENLERLGLVRSDEKRPKNYFSIDPQDGLEKLEKRKKKELELARQNLVDLLRPHYFQQSEHFKGLTGRIVSEDALHLFNELIDNAHSEIILKGMNAELLNQVLYNLQSAKKRSVTIRFAIIGRSISFEQYKKISEFDLKDSPNGEYKYEIDGRMYLKITAVIDSALLVNIYFHTMEDIWMELSRREDCSLCEGKKCREAEPFKPIHGPGPPPREVEMEKVLEALQTNWELTKRQLSKATGLSGGRVAQVVEEMARAGTVKVKKESTGGRPREIVYIS